MLSKLRINLILIRVIFDIGWWAHFHSGREAHFGASTGNISLSAIENIQARPSGAGLCEVISYQPMIFWI
jgi:uncharacterized membrane protein